MNELYAAACVAWLYVCSTAVVVHERGTVTVILIGCGSSGLIQSPMAIVLLSAASRRMSVCVLVCPHTKLKKLSES